MHNYAVFLRKEVMEMCRRKRLLGLLCVFGFFAITSPLLARYMMEFIGALVPGDEALGFLIPDPVWTDSYAQFYSNISQIGNITLILLFMGAICTERGQGTADLMMAKGLGQRAFVLSKFTVISLVLVITMKLSIFIVYLYTAILFDTAGELIHVVLASLTYSLFLLMVTALTLLASAIAKSQAVAALIGFLGFLGIAGISSLPRVGDLLPGTLLARSMEITVGYYHQNLLGNILVTVGLSALFLALAILVLKRKEGA